MILIRSQEREALGRYVEVKIDEHVITGLTAYGTMTVLGAYGSRERAMKVLDKIHSCMLEGVQKDYLDNKYRVKQETVFYMPLK